MGEDPTRHPDDGVAAADSGSGAQPDPDFHAEQQQSVSRPEQQQAGAVPESGVATQAGAAPVRSRQATPTPTAGRRLYLAARELVLVVVIALVASALLRAFVVQAFYVPSGSMLPAIQLNDRILVSRIGDVERGEVVVFEDPGHWIPVGERPPPPSGLRKALEWVGVLPASGHDHLVKRVIGLPGDHVVCCTAKGRLMINGDAIDESGFIAPGRKRADSRTFDVVVPSDHLFVLGDNRYASADSSYQLESGHPQNAFVPTDLVTGRAFAIIWPRSNMQILHIPGAYDDVPDGQTPPDRGIIKSERPALR